ncbi:hypothetical protein GW17_00000387, partial [Ensete ventricosum]
YHTMRNNTNEFCSADPFIRLLQCEGLLSERSVNELQMEFLSVSEFLVEIADDL